MNTNLNLEKNIEKYLKSRYILAVRDTQICVNSGYLSTGMVQNEDESSAETYKYI